MKYIKSAIVLFFVLLFTEDAAAVKIMGEQITYEWRNGLTYNVILKYYMLCEIQNNSAVNVVTTLPLQVSREQDNNPLLRETLTLTKSECVYNNCNDKLTHVVTSDGSVSSCDCLIKEFVYEKEVTLPFKSKEWLFSVESTGRPELSTLASGSLKVYIEAKLNNVDQEVNSSPELTIPPIFLITTGTFHYNLGAIDKNGNSLKYELTSPLWERKGNIVYNTGYSYLRPFGPNSDVTLDSESGALKVDVEEAMQTKIAIKVSEFDSYGNPIGYVIRDIVIFVVPTNFGETRTPYYYMPELSTLKEQGNDRGYNVSLREGVLRSFQITSSDENTQQNLTVSWNEISELSISADHGTNRPTVAISGTPDINGNKNKIYYLWVTVKDSECPHFSQVYTYRFVLVADRDNYCDNCVSSFAPEPGEKYFLSAWVREKHNNIFPDSYKGSGIRISFGGVGTSLAIMKASGPIIEGWQRIEGEFEVPQSATSINIALVNELDEVDVFFDDIRVHPFKSNMKSFVYDPSTQKLVAELDENNYATRYEYDDEGTLIRVKKETERGVFTIKETRSNQSKVHISSK